MSATSSVGREPMLVLAISSDFQSGEKSWHVSDRAAPQSSCDGPRHVDLWRRGDIGTGIDTDIPCPCDIGCPRCGSLPGVVCMAPSGYSARMHQQRIAVSPRAATSPCEHGRHRWRADTDYPIRPASATCTRCGATAAISDSRGQAWPPQ